MNTLDDDLSALFRCQADAMHVPAPTIDQPLARVAPLGSGRERRWLLPAAAVVLVAVGGVALAQRATPASPAAVPATELGDPGAPFSFQTPRVRMTADRIEVIAGDQVIVPTDVVVQGDPGNSQFTTLELGWGDAAAVWQKIHLYFVSDGVSWWASEIRTTDATGEWVFSPEGERWFTSPLGTAWTGDLDLPNLRITNLTIEAFLLPVACDDPLVPIAVVSAYPTIEGVAGGGFGGRIDLIDTATCTAIDPTPYLFTTAVDDPSVAVVTSSQPFPPPTTMPMEVQTTLPGVAVAPTTTIIVDARTGEQYDTATVPPEPFGRFSLEFLAPGTTTVRVTVTDASGTVIGSVAIPLTVLDESTAPTTTITATVPAPPGPSADVQEQAAHRVELATPAIAALGFTESGYTMTNEGVTVLTATDPNAAGRTITIVITPGTMLRPEDHDRTPVTITDRTGTFVRAVNQSNNGWSFVVEVTDPAGVALPTEAQLVDLVYTIDP